MKIINVWLALKDQGPPLRFLKNLLKGHFRGLWHIHSHINRSNFTPKVMYNTKATAEKAAVSMGKKTGNYFSNYKCLHCDGYHIGKNKGNNNWDPNDPNVRVSKPDAD